MSDSNNCGDGFHYILECIHFANGRNIFVQEIILKPKYLFIQLNEMMNTYIVEKLKILSRYMLFQKQNTSSPCQDFIN